MSNKLRAVFLCITIALFGAVTSFVSSAYSEFLQSTPIVLKASDFVPREMLVGSNYTIKGTVLNDGFINTYELDTLYGPLRVESTVLLLKRINEFKALSQIEQIKGTDVYIKAARQVATGPLKTAESLVQNPVGTVSGVASGIGRFLSNTGSAVTSNNPYQSGVLNSALGQASYKRQYAYQLGVDPYSSFEPLQRALNELAWTAAAGGLTAKAAFMAIPGGAGLAVGLTGTADTLSAMVRDKTPAELASMNLSSLAAMGVKDSVAQAFIQNTFFDPEEQTLLVGALASMTGVANRGVFVETSAAAGEESVAVFLRTRAQLMARYHAKTQSSKSFVDAGGVPMLQTATGKIVAIFPLDYVAWTGPFARKAESVSSAIKQMPGVKGKEIWVTGIVDPTARKSLERSGWKVEEKIEQRVL